MEHPNTKWMDYAIALSRQGGLIEKSGGTFGAVIVYQGELVGQGYNQVLKTKDPTWHAEMQAIREASQTLQTPHLVGCVLYTSAECCPMCLAAAYWAHIDCIYYASTTQDALDYGKFDDIDILKEICKEHHQQKIPCLPFMREEAVEVWKEFTKLPNRPHY